MLKFVESHSSTKLQKLHFFFLFAVIRCAPLQNPHYGMVECDSGNLYGSTCIISCIPGYSIVGHDRITCKQDGHWSDDIPFCRSKF